MLYAYTTSNTAYTAGQTLSFVTTGIQTGCTAVKTSPTTIALNKPGYYMIHFNADLFSTTGTGGNVSATLFVNGEAYPAAEATISSTATTDVENIAFTAIVRVEPNCGCDTANTPTQLTVVNGTVAATYSNTAITITKIA